MNEAGNTQTHWKTVLVSAVRMLARLASLNVNVHLAAKVPFLYEWGLSRQFVK